MRSLLFTLVAFLNLIEGATCGRLLVNVDASAPFSSRDFARVASADFIQIDVRNPYFAFERSFPNHSFVVLSDSLDEKMLRSLAERYGYRYVNLKGEDSLENVVANCKDLLEDCPQFSSDFEYLSLEDSRSVYLLMEKIDRVFTEHGIKYWAGGGTLLGAIRHGGMMPWDDDLDLYILESDEEKLKALAGVFASENLSLHSYWKETYKIFEADGFPIVDKQNPGKTFPYRYPHVDIFLMCLERRHETSDFYVHRSRRYYWEWNNDRFSYAQISDLQRVAFGPMTITAPKDAESYLDRLYGLPYFPHIWKTHALEPTWSHKDEKLLPHSGSALVVVDDFSPAPH